MRLARVIFALVLAAGLPGALAQEAGSADRSDGPAGEFAPPFAKELEMRVVAPLRLEDQLTAVSGFRRLITLQEPAYVLALYEHPTEGPGLVRLNGKPLAPNASTGAADVGLGAEWAWVDAAVRSSGQEAIALASTESGGQEGGYRVAIVALQAEAPPNVERVINVEQEPTAVALLEQQEKVAWLTKPSNHFVRVPIEAGEPKVEKDIFPFVPYRYPPGQRLISVPDGRVFGSYKGRLFAYYPEKDFFAYLGHLPGPRGHLAQARLSAAAWADGRLFGGTTAGGHLFSATRAGDPIADHGRPTEGLRIAAITATGDTLWGIAASPGQVSRVFAYKPDQDTFEEFGVPAGTLKEDQRAWPWRAFQIADMVQLHDGRLVLAESARQPKLLVFEPEMAED